MIHAVDPHGNSAERYSPCIRGSPLVGTNSISWGTEASESPPGYDPGPPSRVLYQLSYGDGPNARTSDQEDQPAHGPASRSSPRCRTSTSGTKARRPAVGPERNRAPCRNRTDVPLADVTARLKTIRGMSLSGPVDAGSNDKVTGHPRDRAPTVSRTQISGLQSRYIGHYVMGAFPDCLKPPQPGRASCVRATDTGTSSECLCYRALPGNRTPVA